MFNNISKGDKKRILSLIFIFLVTLICFIYDSNQQKGLQDDAYDNLDDGYNFIHFISVGQGDCTLIETHDGMFGLIDTSTQNAADKITAYLHSRNVSELEFIVFTHPHEDHIGCGDEVLEEFPTKLIYMNDRTQNTSAYDELLKSIKHSKNAYGTKVIMPKEGQTFNLGNIRFEVISDGKGYESINNSSICLKAVLDNNSFLFTGDAEKEVEADILNSSFDIDSDIFKCGHHGSSTSNSSEFIDGVSPDICIVSCGENNDYGHPHAEVLESIYDRNIELYRTDIDGDTVIAFNGDTISVF